MIAYRPSPSRESVSGEMTPCRFTDSINSAIRSSSNSARGFALLGRICDSGTMLSVAVMTGSLLQ
jgi:hypothetical protein